MPYAQRDEVLTQLRALATRETAACFEACWEAIYDALRSKHYTRGDPQFADPMNASARRLYVKSREVAYQTQAEFLELARELLVQQP